MRRARSTTHWSAQLTRKQNQEEYSMSFRRALASILVALAALSVGGSNLAAQLNGGGTSLLVPITGVADLGGLFSGALLVERFVPQANGVAAVGTVTGTLTASGTVRNLVIQVTLPLDVDASRARLNTDAALAQASCDVHHVELGGTSMNVLGSTIGLNPVAFDIAVTLQAASAPTAVSPTTSSAATAATRAAQSGTVTASPSPNTTQPGVVAASTPGVATTPQQTDTQMSLGSLLCSINQFRDVSSPARLAQQLNGILTALGAAQGS
jgi:hypothetical protein